MAPRAPRVVEVRMATLVLWDPQGRRYVMQDAAPFLMAQGILDNGSGRLRPPRGVRVV